MTVESFGSGRSTGVQVAAIERELTRLWRDAAQESGTRSAPVTRACLLNLIVLSRAGSGGARDRVLAEIVQARPARVFLVEVDPLGEGEALQAWISAQCSLPRAGERQVCCEQVTIRLPRGGAGHVPPLLSALAASDLPSCLWLPDELPFDEALTERLVPLSDRILLDSRGAGLEELRSLARLALAEGRPPVADLNWARLLPLRLGVAGLFDSPLMRPLIENIDAIETRGGPRGEGAAALLAGWVRAVLDARDLPHSHEARGDVEEGRITRLALGTSDGSRAVVESSAGSEVWSSRAEMCGACPLPRRTRSRERRPAELLCEELDRSGRDPLYEASLARAVESR